MPDTNPDTTRSDAQGNGSANPTNTTTNRPDTPQGPGSDGEDERSARERLKKTSIANLPQQTIDAATNNAGAEPGTEDNGNGVRGRPAKKRSFEDLARDEAESETTGPDAVGQPPSPKSGHHKRMRSRDIASGEHPPVKFESNTTETVHEETGIDAQKSPGGPAVLIDTPSQEEMDKDDAQRQTQGQAIETTSKIEPTSGFANTSNTSPFGTTNSKPSDPKSTQPQSTSSSAFETSGLSAFASSNSSPFGTASSKSRGFGSGAAGGFGGASSAGFGASTSSGFGNTSSTSAFGAASTSAFGAPRPFGSSTTSSFGTSRPSAFGGGSAIKPFGAPAPFGSSSANSFGTSKPFGSSAKDDEDGSGDDNEDDDGERGEESNEQDPRFHEQHVDTGEEDEDVYFSSRAKLYHFESEWKERGTGVIKINLRYVEESLSTTENPSSTDNDDTSAPRESEDDPEAQTSKFTTMKRKARLLMRADGVHRVILNSPVFKGMKFGTREGELPLGRIMYLQSLGEDGTPRLMQVKVGKEETMKELWHKLRELEEEA